MIIKVFIETPHLVKYNSMSSLYKGEDFMTRTVLYYQNRIAKLKARGEGMNNRIIKKIERKLRAINKHLS